MQSSQWFTHKMVRKYLHNEGCGKTMKAKHIYIWKHSNMFENDNVMWNDKNIAVMMDEYHSTFTISTILKIILNFKNFATLLKVSKKIIFIISKFMTHVFICPWAPPDSNSNNKHLFKIRTYLKSSQYIITID